MTGLQEWSPRIEVYQDALELAEAAAARMVQVVHRLPDAVLGLCTGSTPIDTYRAFVRLVREQALDVTRVRTFNLDEYLGLGPDHPASFAAFMERHLWRHLPFTRAHLHIPRGDAPDPQAEARAYEEKLAAAGPIRLQLLGIGRNGHIGFNEPGSPRTSRTRVVRLSDSTRLANAPAFGGRVEQVPTHAITMGIANVLEAEEILLLAVGSAKADAVRRALTGPVTPEVPASFLRLHPRVSFLLDAAAASLLVHAG